MAAIHRRSIRSPIPASITMATADALTGTVDGTQYVHMSGAERLVIIQINNGTNGTAGIDVVEVSKDGGVTWAADTTTLLLASADDVTGTIVANAALNSAGAEPTGALAFKAGPYEGPTIVRIARGGSGAGGTAWVTGAPTVIGLRVAGAGARSFTEPNA